MMYYDDSELRSSYSKDAGTVKERIQDLGVLAMTVRKRGFWIAGCVDAGIESYGTDKHGVPVLDTSKYEAFVRLMIHDLRTELQAEEVEVA